MPRKKPLTNEQMYNKMVSVSKKVLLAIQVARIEGLKHSPEGMKILGIYSHLHLYGGRPPKYMEELLTYHNMHMMRKEWLDKLFPYFAPFMDGVTKKAMWEAIKEQRNKYALYWTKRRAREEPSFWRIDPDKRFIDLYGASHRDRYPRVTHVNSERLFPMLGNKYVEFLLTLSAASAKKLMSRYAVSASDYELSYGKHRHLVELIPTKKEHKPIDKFAMCDLVYGGSWGEDFRIFVGNGRLHIDELPKYSNVKYRGYITEKGLKHVDEKRSRHKEDGQYVGEDNF